MQPRISKLCAEYLIEKPQQAYSLSPILDHFGKERPDQLTPSAIKVYRVWRHVGGTAQSTVRKELAALVAALNWASGKLILEGPWPTIDLPPMPPPKDLWLDEIQEDNFLRLAAAQPQSRVHRFVAIALDTAARKTAIEKLTWDRVDLATGKIDFRYGTVTKKRNTVVPISTRLESVLFDAAYKMGPNPYVIGQGSIRKAFETFVGRTPYPWVTPHVLRHTWGTLAARRGVDLWKIAGVMGDTLATVEKNYLHHCPEHLRDAVERTP